MFSFKKKQCENCPTEKVEDVDYKQLAKSLQNEVYTLTKQIREIYNETADADFAFDFNLMRAFSIERNWHHDRPCTIIGYIISEPTEHGANNNVKEWYLYCSKEQHAKLVEQFNKVMEKK